jgi:hypothetical protein
LIDPPSGSRRKPLLRLLNRFLEKPVELDQDYEAPL